MRFAHLIYAVAALAGVSAVALNDPSRAMETGTPLQATIMACDPQHLERACDPGLGGADVLDGDRVVVS